MSIPRKARAAVVAGVTVMGLAPIVAIAPAYASPATVQRPDTSCNFSGARMIYQANETHGHETRHIQLWYSDSSRCAWAVETNGQPGDIVWVWNIITHAQSSVTSNSHSAATGQISDAGSESHACMTPKYSNGSYGPKKCTGYY